MARTNSDNTASTCAVDDFAEVYAAMIHAGAMARDWGERYAEHRAVLTDRMGASEVATIAGRPVVRYTSTTQRRINADKVRDLLPADLVALVTVETTSRRFVLVDDAEASA